MMLLSQAAQLLGGKLWSADVPSACGRDVRASNVAGKGHETYQEIKGVKHPFSDAEVAQRALELWRAQA